MYHNMAIQVIDPVLIDALSWSLQNHVDTDGSMEGLVTKHEVWTWELLHVLFSRIEDAEPGSDAMLPHEQPALMVHSALSVCCLSFGHMDVSMNCSR